MTDKRERLSQQLSSYVAWRQAEGDDGKTFLLGLRDDTPVFCVAVGLGDDAGRRHLVTLGRYLLHNRFACRDFVVIWPADLGDSAVYVIDVAQGGQLWRWLLGDDTISDQGPEVGGLLDAMRQPTGSQPAILRRDLDGLFEVFCLPLAPDQ